MADRAPECCNNICDFGYMRSLQAMLKYGEILVAFLAYIFAETSDRYCNKSSWVYFKFMTMWILILMLIVFAIRFFKVHTRCLRCDCLHYNFIEFIIHVACCILLAFACIFMTINACVVYLKVAMVFGWILLVILVCDTVKSFTLTRSTYYSSSTTTETTVTHKY